MRAMRGVAMVAGTVWVEGFRRKDAYVLWVLLAALLGVLAGVEVYGLARPARYVVDAGLLITWVFSGVLVVTLSGRQIAADETSGMVFALLSKPLGRGAYLAGKWLGAWSMALAATLLFYAVVAGMGAVRGGVSGPAVWGQAIALHAAALGIVGALTLALATRLTAGAAMTLGALLAVVGFALMPTLGARAAEAGGPAGAVLTAAHFALPHLELLDLRRRVVHAWGPSPWGPWLASLAYGIGWTALGLLLAWLGFRRRPLRQDGS